MSESCSTVSMGKMKASVITPVYNQARFIEETIRSVLGQDYPDIEYLVLDDGSTDETQEIVRPYLDRIIYIRHENMGESKTVNKGYRLCNGDIIGVVNSDDPLFTPDALSRIADCFRRNSDALAVYPDWVSIDENGNILERFELPEYSIETMLREFNVMIGPGMFIKRTALESIGYRNESLKYTGDLDVSFRLALLGKISHVHGFLATHRVHGQAASSVGKGVVMADEVFQLCKTSLESPLIPRKLLLKKNKILGRAYFTSSYYTKKGGFDFYKKILKAVSMNPSMFWEYAVGRIWLRLPLNLRKHIKRLLKRDQSFQKKRNL